MCGVKPRSLYGQGDRLLREDLSIVRLVLRGRKPLWNSQGCYFVDPLSGNDTYGIERIPLRFDREKGFAQRVELTINARIFTQVRAAEKRKTLLLL